MPLQLLQKLAIIDNAMYQDAVALVAPDNPVALGLAAEVGVNTYATISLPGLTKVHQQPSQSTKEIRVDDNNNDCIFPRRREPPRLLLDLSLPTSLTRLTWLSPSPSALTKAGLPLLLPLKLFHLPPLWPRC